MSRDLHLDPTLDVAALQQLHFARELFLAFKGEDGVIRTVTLDLDPERLVVELLDAAALGVAVRREAALEPFAYLEATVRKIERGGA